MAFQDRTQIIFKAPPAMRDGLQALAKREGETSASILRRIVNETLRANGMPAQEPMRVATIQPLSAG